MWLGLYANHTPSVKRLTEHGPIACAEKKERSETKTLTAPGISKIHSEPAPEDRDPGVHSVT